MGCISSDVKLRKDSSFSEMGALGAENIVVALQIQGGSESHR